MTVAETIAASKKALSVAAVAKIFGCHKNKLYNMIDANTIPYFQVGGMKRFDPATLSAWVEKNTFSTR